MIRCKINLHDIGNTCPICGEQALDALMDEHEDGKHLDTFKCEHCGVMVTYISPDDGRGEYHQYYDGEIEIELEWPIVHSPPSDAERDRLNHLTELAEIITTFDPDDYAIEEHAIYIRSWARIANSIINWSSAKSNADAADNPASEG